MRRPKLRSRMQRESYILSLCAYLPVYRAKKLALRLRLPRPHVQADTDADGSHGHHVYGLPRFISLLRCELKLPARSLVLAAAANCNICVTKLSYYGNGQLYSNSCMILVASVIHRY